MNSVSAFTTQLNTFHTLYFATRRTRLVIPLSNRDEISRILDLSVKLMARALKQLGPEEVIRRRDNS